MENQNSSFSNSESEKSRKVIDSLKHRAETVKLLYKKSWMSSKGNATKGISSSRESCLFIGSFLHGLHPRSKNHQLSEEFLAHVPPELSKYFNLFALNTFSSSSFRFLRISIIEKCHLTSFNIEHLPSSFLLQIGQLFFFIRRPVFA